MIKKQNPLFSFRPSALFPVSLYCLLLALSCALLPPFSHALLQPVKEESKTAVQIIKVLEHYHYLEKDLDDDMSSAVLDRYIKHLDPGKQLFTQKDIRQFDQYRYELDDQLKKGDLSTAFDIFNLYMKQSEKRSRYILSLIRTWEKKIDFTKNESLLIKNDLRTWQPDAASLMPLWKSELKNHIISLLLEDEDPASITQTLEKLYKNRLNRLVQTEPEDVFQIFINIVTASFDPHTQYFPPRASEDFDIHMSLSLEGIGAVLQNEFEYTKVIRLIPKGPADKSELLMPGDKIIGVGQGSDGEIVDTIGQRIDHVVKLIRGPKNTYVRLKIIPADKSTATRTIQIKRDQVKLEEQSAHSKIVPVDYMDRNYKVGIIEIPNFYIDFEALGKGDPDYKSTTRDVKTLLENFKKETIDGLIIDLRDNGGGSLREASQLTGLFLKTGPTVQIKTKYRIRRYYDDDPQIYYTGPLIVLMNRMSASASEIFAGAIKDYQRGVIVGTRSFGKGTVQELQPLGDGRLKLTSAKFYRVSGESTQHMGILPDLKFPRIYKIEDTGESSLDGALPWDTTVRSPYRSYRDLGPVLAQMNTHYHQRAAKDPGLIYLSKRIQLASELAARTRVPLNLEERKQIKMQIEKKELDIENVYLSAIGKPVVSKTDEKDNPLTDAKQILMTQAQAVMADFITLSKKYGYRW